jgi:hypothetical protein
VQFWQPIARGDEAVVYNPPPNDAKIRNCDDRLPSLRHAGRSERPLLRSLWHPLAFELPELRR